MHALHLKIEVLSNLDCDSFRGEEKRSGRHCENWYFCFVYLGRGKKILWPVYLDVCKVLGLLHKTT